MGASFVGCYLLMVAVVIMFAVYEGINEGRGDK